MQVLVIDDSPDNVDLITQILEVEHDVLRSSGGSGGLAMARERRPDLILLDYNMPGMNGAEVLRRLRTDNNTRDIPVIFLSARDMDSGHVLLGLEYGVFDYLNKPVNAQLLRVKIGLVARVLQAEQAARVSDLQLQEAIDCMPCGVSIMGSDLRLTSFNRTFQDLLEFPEGRFRPGSGLDEVLRFNAGRGEYGPGEIEAQVAERLALARRFEAHAFERTRPDGTVVEVRGNPLPGGGFVTLYTDVTVDRRLRQSLTRSAAEEKALGTLLRLSLEDSPMEEYLQRTLDSAMTAVPWLELLPKGGIFLTEDEGRG